VTNKIHLAGWHEAKPAQTKSPFAKEECAHVLVLRMHHAGTSAGSEQSERRSEPRMSIAVEEQV
jgi:hypothetical protein